MTKRSRLPEDEGLDLLRELFVAIMDLDDITKATAEPFRRRSIALGRFYTYVTEPGGPEDPELERALEEDPALRADFRRLLEKTAASYLPQVAAASSGTVERREGQGCRIRFEASRAEPNQTYVIIELSDPETPMPGALFVFYAEYRCVRFALPPAHDGVIQILLEQDSDLLAKLRDIKTEVFLR
jgi:hypothetical protein